MQSQEPWSGVQPHLRQLYRGASDSFAQGGPDFFPGQTFVDPTQEQLAPWNYGFNYMNQAFGGGLGGPTWSGPQDYTQEQPPPAAPYPGNIMGGEFPDLGPGSGPPTALYPYGTGLAGLAGRIYEDAGMTPPWMQGAAQPGGGMQGLDGPQGNQALAVKDTGPPQMVPPSPPQGMQGAGIAPNFGNMVGANQALMTGATPAGMMARAAAPMALGQLNRGFGAPISVMGGDYSSGFDPSSFNFQASAANNPSGLDPTGAIQNMLSGQPNYDMVQDAVRAGAQPTLDILAEDIMPQLRSRTVGSNNPTGEIKDLNRIVPRVMRDITNTGTQAALGEYNRALGAQERGAGLAGQLGTAYSNLGLNAAQFGAGLGQDTAQFDASQALRGDLANQGALESFRNASLGLGNLGAGTAGQLSGDMATGVGQFPSVFNQGMAPFNFGQQYGQMVGGYENMALQDAMNRWNYQQNQPYQNANWYSGILSGAGGLGGTITQDGGQNQALGALGGAATGAGIASALSLGGPWGWGLAGLGGLMGLI